MLFQVFVGAIFISHIRATCACSFPICFQEDPSCTPACCTMASTFVSFAYIDVSCILTASSVKTWEILQVLNQGTQCSGSSFATFLDIISSHLLKFETKLLLCMQIDTYRERDLLGFPLSGRALGVYFQCAFYYRVEREKA